jgi:hypothetical protein
MALTTPRSKRAMWALTLVWYASLLLAEALYYSQALSSGAFRPEADSIGKPLFQFTAAWAAGAPLVLGFAAFALRRYPGRVSLWAYDRAKPLRSLAWTLLLTALAGLLLFSCAQSLVTAHYPDAATSLAGAYIVACWRSSLVGATPVAPLA